jgi:hypothetical protein
MQSNDAGATLDCSGVILNGLKAVKDLACGRYEVSGNNAGGARMILQDFSPSG